MQRMVCSVRHEPRRAIIGRRAYRGYEIALDAYE